MISKIESYKTAATTLLHQFQSVNMSVSNVGKTVPLQSKKISNDQELIQSDPTSCLQNQKGNN